VHQSVEDPLLVVRRAWEDRDALTAHFAAWPNDFVTTVAASATSPTIEIYEATPIRL
jgi:hypothetical protein